MRAFSLSAQFARESAVLKLPEERRRCIFSSPPPPPFPSFALAPTVRVTISTLPNQFHRRKIKDGYNNITNTDKVSPTKNTPALQAIYFRMIILLILITWISEFKPLQTEATFIVGCYKLQPFTHPIACCFALLAFAAQSMKWSNFWVNNSQHFFCSVIVGASRNNVGSVCTALPTLLGSHRRITHGLQRLMGCILPTMHCRSQHCWELLHLFAHHCQRGCSNS